ncbi:MAG: hypothetical protein DSY70_08865 [Desulfobulbus sp.]|nr:MAG: hypothetical protein DSY70_08865 [Desulfobulbus sp.]
MRKIVVYLMVCSMFSVLAACVQTEKTQTAPAKPEATYQPDITHVKNPKVTIKTMLEEQPPAYAYLPSDIQVTDKAITMTVAAGGSFLTMGIPVPGMTKRDVYYYKNLGTPILSKPEGQPVWNVQIVDIQGNVLYWFFANTEDEAKTFINALSYMIAHHT